MRLFHVTPIQKLREMAARHALPPFVLIPAYKKDWEWFSKKKENALLIVKDHTPPSTKMMAFYWGLLGFICENHSFWSDPEKLNVAIKHGLDYYDYTIMPEGPPVKELRPNAKIERNFDEYKEFVDRALDFIVAHIMVGQKAEVIRAVEEWIGGPTLKDAQRGNRGQDTGEIWGDDEKLEYYDEKHRTDRAVERAERRSARKLAAEAQGHSDQDQA